MTTTMQLYQVEPSNHSKKTGRYRKAL